MAQTYRTRQIDHDPAIQHLLSHLRRNMPVAYSETEIRHTETEVKRQRFYPEQLLTTYFEEDHHRRLKNILSALFDEEDEHVVLPTDIIPRYVAVFCILLQLGGGRFIQSFTQSQKLSDKNLPFNRAHQPPEFPTMPREPNFWNQFCDMQWGFCVPKFGPGLSDVDFDPQHILPIIYREKLPEGGSGYLYKIRLQKEYDEFPRRRSRADLIHRPADHFVLKTFFGDHAEEFYRSESEAFRRLGDQPSLIHYYGSYRQANSFNIILEFADKGNLEDYFMRQAPPTRGNDILKFWRNIVRICEPLMNIHRVAPRLFPNAPAILEGLHGDVKPKNILVESNLLDLPYDWQFKIADLGLSYFQSIKASARNKKFEDIYGTRTYGAPEGYRHTDNSLKDLYGLDAKADIWSLGCILSEAAAWIAGSKEGLEKYRRDRSDETERIPGFRDKDCFHDGEEVLAAVSASHVYFQNSLRKEDVITDRIIKVLDRDVLVPHDRRLDSCKVLYKRLQYEIGKAEKQTKDSMDEPSRNMSVRQSPPQLPPGLLARSQTHPRSRSSMHPLTVRGKQREIMPVSFENMRNHANYEMDEDDRHSKQPPNRPPSYQPDSPTRNAHQDEEVFTASYGQRNGRPRRANENDWGSREAPLQSPTSWHQSSSPPGALSQDAKHVRYSETNGMRHRNSSGKESVASQGSSESNEGRLYPLDGEHKTARNFELVNPGLKGSQFTSNGRFSSGRAYNDMEGLAYQHRPVESTLIGPIAKNGAPMHLPAQNVTRSRPAQPHKLQMPLTQPHHSASSSPHRPDSMENSTPDEDEIPYLSVDDALEWKKDSQARISTGFHLRVPSRKLRPELPGGNLLGRLKEYDHAFLIDNAATMEKHWPKVMKTFEAMSYLVKGLDRDGIEVDFTIGEAHGQNKNTSPLLKLVHEQKPTNKSGRTDIRLSLERILKEYEGKLDSERSSVPSFFKSRRVRPLNLYILTDGIWERRSTPRRQIENLANKLHNYEMKSTQVGIQFISFGKEEYALDRLQELDELNTQLDIVDHTPYDDGKANMYKILLGGTNSDFDSVGERRTGDRRRITSSISPGTTSASPSIPVTPDSNHLVEPIVDANIYNE